MVTLIIVDIIGPLNYEMAFAQLIAKLANMTHHVIIPLLWIKILNYKGAHACIYTTLLIRKIYIHFYQ